ncbi:MAG: aminotransferase class I/II-fold pyridoxal phosphate-dependent enzyme [Patescibacteria group bacterium]|jgi:LL-diaminopimelate aminotransferase
MLNSWLPKGGENIFQKVKRERAEAEAAGIKLWPLSFGQPTGPALLAARKKAAEAVMSEDESLHEYQDNGSPGVGDFARRFIAAHFDKETAKRITGQANFDFLPTPGTKSMLGLVPMACGFIRDKKTRQAINPELQVATMTEPGYPTPAVWCDYLGAKNYSLKTTPENQFIFSLDGIQPGTKLIMANYPHNPTGQVADKNFWRSLCAYCAEHGIRLFNDAAYAILTFTDAAATLAEIAIEFPELSWAEAYSSSKVIANGTGWRIGAITGSKDFIEDIRTIKGNTDSGFFAPAAAGVLSCMEEDMPAITANRDTYARRLELLCGLLTERGMKLAVRPKATFFTTWLAPKTAFGRKIGNAGEFNKLMIENTGIVGIPFEPYLRYTVTNPIEKKEWTEAIKKAFDQAKVSY